ncbi:MAG TPA: FHA domain-containing protein [Myxococcales bacterium]|jgi:hypothetical protein|nr:FHA domain-containing protein [Myxococcales bacterium]
MPAKTAAKKKPSELEQLRTRAAKALGVSEEEAELRALRELLERSAPPAAPPEAQGRSRPPPPGRGALPQRLYLLLDGRGLEGRGMPMEVIDVPCIVGSERRCTVWVNSPQIETRHLQITQGDEGWLLEDLGTEHGTFLEGKRIQRRVLQHGDEFKLAGYLRLRTELR